MTLKLSRTWRNETIIADLLAIQSTSDGDGLIRAKLELEINDAMRAFGGYNLFHGKSCGLYGQFRNHDRAFVGLPFEAPLAIIGVGYPPAKPSDGTTKRQGHRTLTMQIFHGVVDLHT